MKFIKSLLFLFIVLLSKVVCGQKYTSGSVFAHNDYAQPVPFYNAYKNQVGYIEADIFLVNDDLFVAHQRSEINKSKTLESLYLIPLQNEIIKNKGWAYADSTKSLVLMIDLKTEGISTLNTLVDKLRGFSEIVNCKNLQVAVSGNVPDPARWKDIPSFIHFDGRPNINYSDEQLARIILISDSFGNYSHWNRKDALPETDRVKVETVIQSVHAKGKKLRFWATPDVEKGWQMLMNLQVDVIGTDNVTQLLEYMKK